MSEDENEEDGHDRNQFEVSRSRSRSRGVSGGWDEKGEKDDGEDSD